jgi:hypothetical protein
MFAIVFVHASLRGACINGDLFGHLMVSYADVYMSCFEIVDRLCGVPFYPSYLEDIVAAVICLLLDKTVSKRCARWLMSHLL